MLSSTMHGCQDKPCSSTYIRTYVSASSICYGIVIFSRALQFEIAFTCGVIAVYSTITYVIIACYIYVFPVYLNHISSNVVIISHSIICIL